MKKAPFLICLLLAATAVSAFSFGDWGDSFYQKIKTETINGLRANFNLPGMVIGNISDLMINQVVFDDVSIPTVVFAKKVRVNYNLLKFPFYKDIVPTISTIVIEDAVFEVNRQSGGALNVNELLRPVTPTSPPPPPFKAKLIFKNCQINYHDEVGFRTKHQHFSTVVDNLNGSVSFQHKNQIRINLTGKNENQPIKINGTNNYANGQYNFTISGEKLDLAKWGNYTVPVEPLSLTGGTVDLTIKLAPPRTKAWPVALDGKFNFNQAAGHYNGNQIADLNGQLTISDDKIKLNTIDGKLNTHPLVLNGTITSFTDPAVNLDIDLDNDQLYGYPLSGQAKLLYKHKLLQIEVTSLKGLKGVLTADLALNFTGAVPQLTLKSKLQNIDLAALAQNSPGIVGRATGDLQLTGPLDDLSGHLDLGLAQALLLGQPLDKLGANLVIRQGEIFLENFTTSSKTAFLQASGKVSKDLLFTILVKAKGIKLSGQGVLGKMEALINSFRGNIKFKLDNHFLSSPLKNLQAAGVTVISNGQIGQQHFDLAEGEIALDYGLISVKNVSFHQQKSVLQANGKTGVGQSTQLQIQGVKVNLEDLKILNHFLPSEAQNPQGIINLALNINGELPALTSLDPLLDLQASGEVSLIGTKLAEIPIEAATMEVRWLNRHLSFPTVTLITPHSNLQLAYNQLPGDQQSGSVVGIVDLSEFQKLTNKYGHLTGQIGLNLTLGGTMTDPKLASGFWFKNFRFNTLNLDRIEGSAVFADHQLSTIDPWLVQSDANRFAVTGEVDFRPLLVGKPEEISLSVGVNVIKSDLASAIILGKKIQGEVVRKIFSVTKNGKATLNLDVLELPTVTLFRQNGNYNLYSQEPKNPGFLASWKKTLSHLSPEQIDNQGLEFGGQLTGDLSLHGQVRALIGECRVELNKGNYRDFTFDNGKARASLVNNQLKIDQLEISKSGGKLTTQGNLGFNGQVNLKLAGENFPLDILKTFFNKSFTGAFYFKGSVSGTITNPDFAVAGSGSKINLAEVDFDRFSLRVNKRNDLISITEFSLFDHNQSSTVTGSLDLSADGQVNLAIDLHNNGLGLLNLLTDDVKWRRGEAVATLSLQGLPEQLKINGNLTLNKTVLYVPAINSEIKEISGSAEVVDGLLTTTSLTGVWQGKTTRNYANQLALAGTVGLDKIFSANPGVDLNLALSPTWLYLDLPNTYTGALRIDAANLFGRLSFDLSSGPRLKGQARVENALISLSRQAGGAKPLPLDLDLTVDLNKNVYAILGDVATLDLSNIFLNLEINSPQLYIGGTLASPSLHGKLQLKRGTVSIFNREFSLLNVEQLKSYYPYNAEKVKDNTAFFAGGEGAEGVLPEIDLTAKVEVENEELDSNKLPVKKQVIVLSHLKGKIGSTDRARGLNISFDSFIEDKNKIPSEMVAANYSEQDIKVMLLPDFIKSLAGINNGTNSSGAVNTNVIVADYISSRIQTVVFRGLERQLEQGLGLENLTLEYNFGKDVRQAMGVSDRRLMENERPDWRVGFVKGFFDKFFLEVNYAQIASSINNTPTQQSFNYQMTYKLSPIWAIIYFREPNSPQDLATGYQKVTLKAGFSFW